MRNELIDFLVPSGDTIRTAFSANGDFLSASNPWSTVPSWHQGADLRIGIAATLDLERIAEQTCIPSESTLRLGLSVYSPKTRLKFIAIQDLQANGEAETFVDVPPHQVAGDLLIQGFLTVRHGSDFVPQGIVAPSNAVIWSNDIRCELEGDQGRAEIHPVDFSAAPDLNRNALWVIDSAFPGSVSEWVESEINNCISIRYNAQRTEEIHSPIGTQMLKAEYVRAILEETLKTEGLLEYMFGFKGDQDLWGSLIKTAFDVVSTVIPGATPSEVKAFWNYNQKSIESRIQGLASK